MNEKTTTPPADGETDEETASDALSDTAQKSTVTESSDNAPPMNSPARGPMNQTTPDVATGSTPLTRRDD